MRYNLIPSETSDEDLGLSQEARTDKLPVLLAATGGKTFLDHPPPETSNSWYRYLHKQL
jgi:hypothetical protein